MKIDIVFSDIDGTLLNNQKVFSQTTIDCFKKIKEDIPVILISSRMPSAMTHLQDSVKIEHLPLIAYNGGLIIHNNEILEDQFIPTQIIQQIVDFNHNQNIHISLFNNNDWYVPRNDYWTKREVNNTKTEPTIKTNQDVINLWSKENKGAHKIMCMGDSQDIQKMYDFLEENFADSLHLYRSKETYIEIAINSISKKTAVEYILKKIYPLINIENAAAFGDNYNDIEMLEAVGIGVAVENAKPEVKLAANHTTLAGNKDGVAKFINQNL